jgi:hypothetical protein
VSALRVIPSRKTPSYWIDSIGGFGSANLNLLPPDRLSVLTDTQFGSRAFTGGGRFKIVGPNLICLDLLVHW